jgi:hypothetical protein
MAIPIHTETVDGFTINIYPDPDPMNPREDMDCLGTIYHCSHRHHFGSDEVMDIDDIKAMADNPDIISLPVFLYDHSGLSMSTKAFSCPWDSGQIGIIAIDSAKAANEFGGKRVTKALRDRIIKCLEAEIKCYNNYLEGFYCGYVVTDKYGNDVDSCWGFETLESCLSEAKANLPDETYGYLPEMAV